jgi:hypothetical protein
VPPVQYVTRDFPVLSAGPTPRTPLDRWASSIVGEVDEPRRWTWEEFRALPSEEVTVDIHCVHLIGFQNRLLVLIRWSFSFATHGRGARLITGDSVAADQRDG